MGVPAWTAMSSSPGISGTLESSEFLREQSRAFALNERDLSDCEK